VSGIFAQENFVLNGEIEGEKRGKVILKFTGFKQYLKTKLVDGKFQIKGELKRPTRVVLSYKGTYSIPFYLENSNINITFKKDKLINVRDSLKRSPKHVSSEYMMYDITSIQGSLSDNLYRDYIQFKKENITKSTYKYLLFNYLNENIEKYPDSYVYVSIINDICRRQEYLTYSQQTQLLKKLDLSKLDEYSKQNLLKNIERYKNYGIGNFFPEKYATDLNGESQLLSEFYGKYTLIDFWASWCKPCRIKNPKIKALYSKYNTKGFNVVAISSDRDAEKWKLAIQKDGLPWSNFISSTLYRDVLISSIPYTFLLDEEGQIVGINLTVDKIESILKQNL
jgi:thiol-disulfide isomerase/thioredoxin